VTNEIAAIVERARLGARPAPAEGGGDRTRLEGVAQEFEAMLLVQVLRSMRTSGAWEDPASQETLGAETMFETMDVELASHLARVHGLGLGRELLAAFDRRYPAIAASAAAPGESASGDGQEPVGGDVTSSFGWRHDPFTGALRWHRGVDLRAAYGEDVRAARDGRVVFSGEQGSYGTTVLVEHEDGSRSRYAHLSVALVAPGGAVASGQAVGRAGRSGRATGTHVHFEITDADGRHVDPVATLAQHTRRLAGD
jgi:murein DD-endopeptidase MepM/ murein hydrolase activator NlpD